jgi:TIR domain
VRGNITIFISYAHADEQLCTELRTHLSSLERVKSIEVWSDRDIRAGAEWKLEIHYYLNTAQIILLLISPDFMDSDFCYSIEMKQAMERDEAGKASVIPIILRPVFWEDTPFAKLQVLLTRARPVISEAWYTRDDGFLDIVQGVRKVVEGAKIQRRDSISIFDDHKHY